MNHSTPRIITALVAGIGFSVLAAQPEFAPELRVDKFITIPAEAKRGRVPDVVPKGVVAHVDLVYGHGGDKPLLLDLYEPATKEDRTFPGVIVIHGGGWENGSRRAFRAMCQQLALRGFVAATIDYRLSGEARFPAAVEDCKAAVRWMRANAAKYRIDPQRIGAVGGSAGGHLAAMVALTTDSRLFEGTGGHPEFSSTLKAYVIMGTGVDQLTRAIEAKKPIGNQLTFFGGTYQQKRDLYAQGSPINHISKSDPPVLIIEGEKDTPGERYPAFRNKLDEAGTASSSSRAANTAAGEVIPGSSP
jgi:acetyl esterase/lipase